MSDIRTSVSPESRSSSPSGGSTGPTGPSGAAGAAGPAGATGPTGSAGFPPVIASANVVSDGALIAATGIATLVHAGTGLYQVTLSNPPANMANAGILALPFAPSLGVSGQTVINSTADPDQFEIATFDATGTAADRSFTLIVYDLTP